MIHTAKVITSFVALAAISACSVVGSEAAPEPGFDVVLIEEPFEIRDYDELVVVQTPMNDGTRAGFGRLFDYISGENEGSREIAMTAPVINADTSGAEIAMTAPVLQSNEGERVMMFILPDEMTFETAPFPSNPQVTLATIAPRRVAVIRYSGSLDDDAPEAESKLRGWLDAKNLAPIGPAETAGYNPPWTLPAYRRNEVIIPVATE